MLRLIFGVSTFMGLNPLSVQSSVVVDMACIKELELTRTAERKIRNSYHALWILIEEAHDKTHSGITGCTFSDMDALFHTFVSYTQILNAESIKPTLALRTNLRSIKRVFKIWSRAHDVIVPFLDGWKSSVTNSQKDSILALVKLWESELETIGEAYGRCLNMSTMEIVQSLSSESESDVSIARWVRSRDLNEARRGLIWTVARSTASAVCCGVVIAVIVILFQ